MTSADKLLVDRQPFDYFFLLWFYYSYQVCSFMSRLDTSTNSLYRYANVLEHGQGWIRFSGEQPRADMDTTRCAQSVDRLMSRI